jgi:hypothetical protein
MRIMGTRLLTFLPDMLHVLRLGRISFRDVEIPIMVILALALHVMLALILELGTCIEPRLLVEELALFQASPRI